MHCPYRHCARPTRPPDAPSMDRRKACCRDDDGSAVVAVLVLTRRIRWFDMGAQTNAGQHHHAWVVFDHAHPPGKPPVLIYA